MDVLATTTTPCLYGIGSFAIKQHGFHVEGYSASLGQTDVGNIVPVFFTPEVGNFQWNMIDLWKTDLTS